MRLSHADICMGSPTLATTTFQSVDLSARSTSQTVPGLPHCLHISCITQLQASDCRRKSESARRQAAGGQQFLQCTAGCRLRIAQTCSGQRLESTDVQLTANNSAAPHQ